MSLSVFANDRFVLMGDRNVCKKFRFYKIENFEAGSGYMCVTPATQPTLGRRGNSGLGGESQLPAVYC